MRVRPDSLDGDSGASKLLPYARISDKEELLIRKVQTRKTEGFVLGFGGERILPGNVGLGEARIGYVYRE